MHKSFNVDRREVLARAQAAGVVKLIITGTSERSSQEAAAFAQKSGGILYATAGVHPHDSKHCTPATITVLRDLAKLPEVVAIGECGLDYNRDFSPRPIQDRWFEAQIQLACELKMPLFLHEREAHQRFIEILSNYSNSLNKVVVHCFTGTAEELDKYLSMGFYIGVTGWICDDRRGTHLRGLVQRIPLDRLMLETDAPFLTPRDLRPQPANRRNEPAFLPHILNTVANAMEKSPEAVAVATTATAQSFWVFREIGGKRYLWRYQA
ncbi:MAG: TatD family hydrolase, partial [Chloroflexota bacterium]